MYQTVDISKKRYEGLKSNPIFFLKFCENIQYDSNGKEIDYSTWCSSDRDLNISFDANNFADRTLDYSLCVIDKAEVKKDDKGNVIPDVISILIHSVSFNSVSDWIYIINSFILRSQNKEDKYAFMELLWALDKLPWKKRILISAFSKYPLQTIPFLINNLQKFGRVLSYYKQQSLKEICEELNGRYIIYSPDIMKQAYSCISNKNRQNKPEYKELNLFSIIDSIFEQDSFINIDKNIAASNSLFKIYTWLHNESPLDNYGTLLSIYPILSEKYRFLSIKRYFHDLRNKYTFLDISFLQSLKENKYDELIRFRHCIESPTEPIVLTAQLLCDTLITLYRTKGQTFQTFDGILDFAMTHCDTTHPAIDFKLDRFIPTCNGGAVFNESFKGFIDYALIRKLNKETITTEHLRSAFIYLMDKNGKRQTYPVCNYGDGSSIISEEVFKHCSQIQKYKIDENGQKHYFTRNLNCFHYQPYEDRWIITHKNISNIRDFLKEKDIQFNQLYNISLEMLSFDKLKEYIWNIPKKFKVLCNGEFLVHSYKTSDVNSNFDLYLVQKFSDILKMRIFPQEGSLVGLKLDIFGFWEDIRKNLPEEVLRNTQSEQYKEAYSKFKVLELQEVRRRCIDSLKKELNSDFLNNIYYEMPFNRPLLSNIIKRFYHRESFHMDDKSYQHEFLKVSNVNSHFAQLCAPQLSEEKNPAINLPYFWCRGKECFHNNLGTQTLQEESHWINYSLFHLTEIMGYPMLRKTEGGYEPKQSVSQFIAISNKVMQKFTRLKCKSCGHMMFTYKSSGFNRYNYYSCVNPTCSELSKAVYLNFCFKCKKGLIDSRDTKQCPNGWYICPTCLACCDDEQYERQAQRYTLTKRPVPLRIQEKMGHGHNDKGKYFCIRCGGAIVNEIDEHNNIHKKCKDCGITYDEQLL